jgi:hypothetical protein
MAAAVVSCGDEETCRSWRQFSEPEALSLVDMDNICSSKTCCATQVKRTAKGRGRSSPRPGSVAAASGRTSKSLSSKKNGVPQPSTCCTQDVVGAVKTNATVVRAQDFVHGATARVSAVAHAA